MPRLLKVPLTPRKAPVQARSSASVEAILEATIQVLLGVGKQKLTTAKVAERAGVSVGTLYQYFPNKSALLRAVWQRHLERIADQVIEACNRHHGHSLEQLAEAIAITYFRAKTSNLQETLAIYKVTTEVDGLASLATYERRMHDAFTSALSAAPVTWNRDVRLIASMLQATLAGVGRVLLESPDPAAVQEAHREELIFFLTHYLRACSDQQSGGSMRVF